MFTAESEKRNRLWEECTAKGLAAEREQKYDDAQQMYEQALTIAAKFSKTDLRRTMTAIDYANMLHRAGDDKRAQPLYEQAVADYERWRKTSAQTEEINRIGKKMASCYLGLAQIYATQKRNEDAQRQYENALALTKKGYFTKRFTHEVSQEYAAFARKSGDMKKADSLTKPQEALAEGLEAQLFNKPLVDKEWAKVREDAFRLEDKGEWDKASEVRRQGIAMSSTRYGVGDSRTMQLINELANSLATAKKVGEAEKVLLRGIKDHGEKPDPMLAEMYNQLGRARLQQKRYEQSIKDAERAAEIAHQLEEGAVESDAYWLIGNNYDALGERAPAIAVYERGLKVRQSFSIDGVYYSMLLQLCDHYIKDNRLTDAQHRLEAAAAGQSKVASTVFHERTLRMLARVYQLQGDEDKSKQTAAAADRLKQG